MKPKPNDLALFGGAPLFANPRHVNQPWVGERKTFDKHLDSTWNTLRFTNDGPLANDLEQRLAAWLGVENCVLMSSGTMALTVLLSVLDVKGEAIMPSFTFISTAHALTLAGIKPVFCDVSPGDWNISPECCERLITERTGAIIPTHLWGRPCDVTSLKDISDRYDIPLIFDAAHAFGCSHNGRMIGSFGSAEVFSFHATKAFHTGEGGAVTCDDPALAKELRLARNFGFVDLDRVERLGTNAKMSELSAAMGLTNLDGFDNSVAANETVFNAYRDRIEGLDHISLIPICPHEHNNYWYIATELSEDCPIQRDNLIAILHAENILARRYFYPGCHAMVPYSRSRRGAEVALPNTKKIADSVLVLPGGPHVSNEDVNKICDLLEFVLEQSDDITTLLGKASGAKYPE